MCVLEYRRTAIAMNKLPKSGLAFDANFEHPTLQGATALTHDTQGVAALALGYVLHWAFSPPLLNLKLEFVIDLGIFRLLLI